MFFCIILFIGTPKNPSEIRTVFLEEPLSQYQGFQMKRPVFAYSAFSLATLLMFSGCGGGSSDSSPEPNYTTAAKSVVLANDARCPNGGVEIFTGVDTNGDGILQEDEYDNSEVICNGSDGTDGEDGHNTLIVTTPLSESNTTCSNGGYKIQSGLDSNDNDALDASEVISTGYFCNPSDGLMIVSSDTVLPVGDGNCAFGGLEIKAGYDLNQNAVLDQFEVNATRYICNGINGFNSLISETVLPVGDSNCSNGGISTSYGLDINRNGVLENGEINATNRVCNGLDGLNIVMNETALAIGDANCPFGGAQIDAGYDYNRNQTLDNEEVNRTRYICNGADGFDSLVSSTELAIGDVNCANGGLRLDFGKDGNRNGILDTDEINTTRYVCNGVDGADGIDGFTTLVANASVPIGDTECANGGVEITFGLDTNRNSILETSEISSSRKICNGLNGQDAQTAPIIHTLHASPAIMLANTAFELGAVVTDPDGGSMTFSWKDHNGTEISTSKRTSQTAPAQSGTYLYSFTAIDDQNHSVTGYVNVQVVSDTQSAETQTVAIGDSNISVDLPPEVTPEPVTGDMDGTLLVAGSNQEVGGAIFTKPAFNSELTAQEMLTNTINTISTNITAQFSNVSTRNHSSNPAFSSGVTAYYDIQLGSTKKPVELLNEIIQLIGSNVQGGVITTSLSALASATSSTAYRMAITIQYIDADHIVIRFALVTQNDYASFEAIISDIVNPGSIKVPGMITESAVEHFTARATTTQMADFLFVIDNSGSMSGEQTAIQQAASDFASELNISNLDFHIGIITTDNSNLVNGDFIDNNITEFQNRVIVGTNGSPTETGIWEAEQSLLSIALGDSVDGATTLAGYPRTGATLSVIILSDEPSQYTRRSGGSTFDPLNNLFVDRGYTFYSIVNTNSDGQYIDLSDATGGTYTSIYDLTAFPAIMGNIAASAGAAASGYRLSDDRFINAASINVYVEGNLIPKDENNGWSFHEGTRTVLFHGSAIPNAGDQITVAYDYSRFAEVVSLTVGIDANATFYIGDSIALNATGRFEDNSTGQVNLSELNITSANASIISIVNGLPVAAGAGQTDLTLTAPSGASTTISIVVNDYPLLPLNQVTTGRSIAAGGYALYRIETSSTGLLSVTTISGVDTFGYLYDNNMSQLTYNDDSGANGNFLISYSVSPGTYYVKVTGFSGREVAVYDINTTFQ